MGGEFRSPKQPAAERSRDWYPYYAGFTQSFAESVFESYFSDARSVVDPWNGSGTTTTVAVSKGVGSLGVDINPALTIVALARLVPASARESLKCLGATVVEVAADSRVVSSTDDPLRLWLRTPAVNEFRRLQQAVEIVVGLPGAGDSDLARRAETDVAEISPSVALLHTALFAACRDALRPYRASNPTWVRTPESFRHRLQPSAAAITAAFVSRLKYLGERLMISESATARADIRTGTAVGVVPSTGEFDACCASPPYATRIDYIKSTLPELAMLGVGPERVQQLRKAATGTPVVRGAARTLKCSLPPIASSLVDEVRLHASHGSSSYYAPWISNYLSDLDQTLDAIHCAVKPRGVIALVVQDSYYKRIKIDLQAMVTESLNLRGRALHARHDFPVTHSMASMNSRARTHLSERNNVESLLVFR